MFANKVFAMALVLAAMGLVGCEKTMPVEPAASQPGPAVELQAENEQIEPAEVLVVVPRYRNIGMTAEECEELAAIIYLEAGNQGLDGQQAVAEVVFNRVINHAFPDSVHEVLHAGESTNSPQFSTIYRVSEAKPGPEQYEAIAAALYGPSILPDDVVFFSRTAENSRVWGKIGAHVFCREYVW